jgi:hypothetical protein
MEVGVRSETLVNRSVELKEQLAQVLATKHTVPNAIRGAGEYVDHEKFIAWKVSAKHLLVTSQFLEFEQNEKPLNVDTNLKILKRIAAVFAAAEADYLGGLFNSLSHLVQAEVFDTQLDQARELLASGYASPAAVVAGVVLETTIKGLCGENGIPLGKLGKMNEDLTKAGVYNKLVQKKVQVWADVRNNAAHGHYDQFEPADVQDMIRDIETFVSERLA